MNYNFLATGIDKIQVFEFIFEHTDLQVFDLSSEFGQEACWYKKASEIAAKFDLENGGQFAITLQLWSPRFGGAVAFRRINLNPERCGGHTFRYATGGWGLIQLYLGGCQRNNLHHSNIGHFNERGALGRADDDKELAEVKRWNWKEIVSTPGRLRRQISKMAVRKFDGMDVLPGADALSKSGVALRY
ncbi:hypothetical protein [Hymenobacter negativus]|uniref:Uncharacterized protein n=1 Tax=Hymenobacter negativus TaxID=2795026 RepID=A0ABS3QJM4_9BACT|nr:hypothetical protein [Hymenobacter negativus]MBO2011434.1 hypothetical protein [Hymenobacter negativus]